MPLRLFFILACLAALTASACNRPNAPPQPGKDKDTRSSAEELDPFVVELKKDFEDLRRGTPRVEAKDAPKVPESVAHLQGVWITPKGDSPEIALDFQGELLNSRFLSPSMNYKSTSAHYVVQTRDGNKFIVVKNELARQGLADVLGYDITGDVMTLKIPDGSLKGEHRLERVGKQAAGDEKK